jgi:hypothetical protein
VGSQHLASGAIYSGLIGNSAVNSGNITSGIIGTVHIASGGLGSGAIGSGQIGFEHIASGSIQSGDLADTSVISGSISSGCIGVFHMGSGTIVPAANWVSLFTTGATSGPLSAEIISGVRAVHINSSGQVRIAMASVSGRMPAIGFVRENVAAGVPVQVLTNAAIQFTSGLAHYSGYLGQFLFVGRSGQIAPLSGSWSSGGFLSGDLGQIVGVAYNSGAGICNIGNYFAFSGGPIGLVDIGGGPL